jgi:hypothetical protein
MDTGKDFVIARFGIEELIEDEESWLQWCLGAFVDTICL